MNPLELAQLLVHLCWRIAAGVKDQHDAARHFNADMTPDPGLSFTACGLMLVVHSSGIQVLSPWGRVNPVKEHICFSGPTERQLIHEFDAVLVGPDDPANSFVVSAGGSLTSARFAGELYAIRRFGDVALPTAVGSVGLAAAVLSTSPRTFGEGDGSLNDAVLDDGGQHSANSPEVQIFDPNAYDALCIEWQRLLQQLDPTPQQLLAAKR